MASDHIWGCGWDNAWLILMKFSKNVGMIPIKICNLMKVLFTWTSLPQIDNLSVWKSPPCRLLYWFFLLDFPLGSFSANLHFSLIWIKIYKIYKMIKSLTIWRNFTFMFHGQQTSEISRTFLSATLGINYYKGIFKPSSFAFLTLHCCRKEIVKLMFSKKATKIDEIFTGDLTLCSKCQIDGEDFVNFCGLLRKPELYQKVRCGSKQCSN